MQRVGHCTTVDGSPALERQMLLTVNRWWQSLALRVPVPGVSPLLLQAPSGCRRGVAASLLLLCQEVFCVCEPLSAPGEKWMVEWNGMDRSGFPEPERKEAVALTLITVNTERFLGIT